MIAFLTLLAVLVIFISLAFFSASMTGWGLAVVLAVFFMASQVPISDQTLLLIGGALGLVFAVLGIPIIRRKAISAPLFRAFCHALPLPLAVSDHDLGKKGWEAGLFNGHPNWKQWLALPKYGLSQVEQDFLNQETTQLCSLWADDQHVEQAQAFLKAQGFLALTAPEASGGRGFSAQAHSAVVSKIASCCGAAARGWDEKAAYLYAARCLGGMKHQAKVVSTLDGNDNARARVAALTYLVDSAQQMTTLAIDHGEMTEVVVAMMQSHANELASCVLHDVRNMQSSSQPVCFEGLATDFSAQQVFKQGVLRLHPYLFKEISAAQYSNPERALLKFDAALRDHIRFTLSNAARSWVFGVTGGFGLIVPGGDQTTRYYQRLTRFSAAFALCTDLILLRVRNTRPQHQALLMRLGEIAGLLYLAAATLKRFEDENRPKTDLPLLAWAMQYCLYRIQQTFAALLNNLPHGMTRWLLKQLIFPLGKKLQPPADVLAQQVVRTF